ncbi:MAG TPA: methionyl-tRNA formyltransferase [Nitriliruptoraceae bacterium]|nr:methionyl-tRNA formyltransferase [Nitriliruptoraceae bacterium]
MTRIVFFGTPDVAVPSLDALVAAADLDVVAVVTNPDRPRGRSRTPRPSAIKEAAVAADIEVWQPERGKDVAEKLRAAAPDICAVVAYGSLLPRAVLDIPTHGFVNLHFSRLPRWRGAAPVQHAIRAGDAVTGVTTFVLDEGMDTGPIVEVTSTPIGPGETAGELLERLAVEGAPVLVRAVRDLAAGGAPTPQPETGATLAPKITNDDVALDFSEPAARVAALVRSAAPRPGAHTTWRGDRFKLLGAVVGEDVSDPAASPPPGTIVATASDGLVVQCGDGVIRATRVQPAGKAAMDAGAFVNGYQPDPGERLGT